MSRPRQSAAADAREAPSPRDGARRLRLLLDSDLRHVSLAGKAVQRLASLAGFSDPDASQVALCLAEAVNNSIRHAYHGEPGHQVEIEFCLEADRIVLEVTDQGTPMAEPPGVPTLDFDPDELASIPEGGMGLFIIHSVMDRMEYGSHGGRNTLTMIKLLRERD